MLKKCPECNLQVSDKAFSCPHCGFPFEKNIKPIIRKSTKRKRLPNGFGQITELKNLNLRQPFRVMVTVGFDEETGRPISKLLKPRAYFETYNEAYEALLEYNKNPYEIRESATLKNVYEKWYAVYIDKTRPEREYRHLKSMFNYLKPLWDTEIREIKSAHLKGLLESLDISPVTVTKVKSLVNKIFDYAVEYNIITINPARNFKLSHGDFKNNDFAPKGHIDFTDYEIKKLWNIKDKYYIIKMILIQCYMGWRPQELCMLETANVDIENWTIKGGMKTTAGKNRIVPIHTAIRNIVLEFYNKAVEENSKYLFVCTDDRGLDRIVPMNYDRYRKRYYRIMKEYNFEEGHRTHDPRVHFITQCKLYEVDEYAIKYMAGHSIQDITEQVYTKRKAEWYAKEIEKIKIPCKN